MLAAVVWPGGDPERVVRAILAEPIFRLTPLVRPKPPWWKPLWDWIARHVLEPLFPSLARALGASRGPGSILALVLAVLALALFAYALARIVRALVGSAGRERRRGLGARALSAVRTSVDWQAAARDAAACGRWREAIAFVFRAALAALDERDLVAYDAARSPGEYRRRVRERDRALAPAFDALAERFVRARFGPEPSERSDYEGALGAFDAFVRASLA
ncbi:MAG: DUF4129 domain-containing protein [Vulcanimicrobiaceae bacterium]